MARSRILLLTCLIVACKSALSRSIWSIIANHFSISVTIRCCSANGGSGICKDNSNPRFNPGINPFAFDTMLSMLFFTTIFMYLILVQFVYDLTACIWRAI